MDILPDQLARHSPWTSTATVVIQLAQALAKNLTTFMSVNLLHGDALYVRRLKMTKTCSLKSNPSPQLGQGIF